MKKMKNYAVIFYSLFLVFLFSCDNKLKLKKEKYKNEKEVNKCKEKQFFFRSELSLFQTDDQNLDTVIKNLNYDHPYFFNDSLIDFFKDIALDDNFNIIFDSVYTHFSEMDHLFNIINGGFCSLKNYFPAPNPRIVTMIDDDIIDTFSPPFNPIAYDYEKNIIFIQIQWFLGKDHVFYANRNQPIPDYLTESYHQKFIPSLLFNTMGSYYAVKDHNTELLVTMINEAKPYFFAELMLPHLNDDLIFVTNQNDIDFFNQNVGVVWRYILENQFLFSSESSLKQQFITPAKTTQLGTPGRFGVWIGWQILRSYYNNNDVSLQEILKETNYLEILNKSNYKP
mgnify:CR=1 FL=1